MTTNKIKKKKKPANGVPLKPLKTLDLFGGLLFNTI
jgi:hypothetical protein